MTDRPTTFDVDQLRADIAAGRSIVSIAREWGVSENAVRNALRRCGITRPPRSLGARCPELEDAAWLRTEYIDRRRSVADIARQMGCSAPTVRDYLARAGIATRRPHS